MLRRSVTFADRLVLRRVARRLPEPVGAPVTWLGGAARGGGLWWMSATILAAFGRRGRRAATSGLVAYGIAAAVANGPAKWLVRRPRPGGVALLGVQRRGLAPGTSSFPSSHTAGAAAFGVAASSELPGAAALLVPATLGVAVARMRAVRHYPSDVAAGAALGIAIGAATAYAVRRQRGRTSGAVLEPAE